MPFNDKNANLVVLTFAVLLVPQYSSGSGRVQKGGTNGGGRDTQYEKAVENEGSCR